jgi:hypothetical protein
MSWRTRFRARQFTKNSLWLEGIGGPATAHEALGDGTTR